MVDYAGANQDLSLLDEMIDHAAKVFARQEFHRTRTSELAVRNKFSEGRYFSYFKNKDGILRALFHRYWREMVSEAQKAQREVEDPFGRLCALVSATFSVYRQHPHLFRVTVTGCYPSDPPTESQQAEHFPEYIRLAHAAVGRACRNCDDLLTVMTLFSFLRGGVQAVLNEHYVAFRGSTGPQAIRDLAAKEVEVLGYVERLFARGDKNTERRAEQRRLQEARIVDEGLVQEDAFLQLMQAIISGLLGSAPMSRRLADVRGPLERALAIANDLRPIVKEPEVDEAAPVTTNGLSETQGELPC